MPGSKGPKVTPYDRIVGEIVRKIRVQQRWSRRELVEELDRRFPGHGISDALLCEHELGRSRVSTVRFFMLADVLRLDVEQVKNTVLRCCKAAPEPKAATISPDDIAMLLPEMTADQLHQLRIAAATIIAGVETLTKERAA